MNRGSAKPLERAPGEAWIDAIETTLKVQTDLFVNSLRWWSRLSFGAVATQAEVARSAGEAAVTSSESISRTLTEEARRMSREPEATMALEALTVEQLDRLASSNDVDNYPHSGAKRDKVGALASVGLTLDTLSVEQLDRLAETNNVEEYPRSASKSEKITALEAAAISLG